MTVRGAALNWLALTLWAVAPLSAQSTGLEWAVATAADIEPGTFTRLGDAPYSRMLSNGWACEVNRLSATARRLTCTESEEAVSALIDCRLPRGEDHVQLAFDSRRAGSDFIELSCRRVRR